MAKKRRRTFGTVAKLPSGRYRARYFYQGVFHNAPETYRAVADANAWLTVEESKILQGTWVPVAGSAMTVAGLAERWLASNPLKRDSSRSGDASTVHYIKPIIGNLKVAGPTKVAACRRWSTTGPPCTTWELLQSTAWPRPCRTPLCRPCPPTSQNRARVVTWRAPSVHRPRERW